MKRALYVLPLLIVLTGLVPAQVFLPHRHPIPIALLSTCVSSLTNGGLISYWKLEESVAGADRVDSFGTNDLTASLVTNAIGKCDNGQIFSHLADQRLTHVDDADLSTGNIDFTIAAWVKMVSTNNIGAIVSKLGVTFEYQLQYTKTTDLFTWRVSTNGSSFTDVSATSFGKPDLNIWHLIIVWHDSVNDQCGIEIDNSTTNTVANANGVFDSTAAFNIGNNSLAGNLSISAVIDEVAFWKRLLTATEKTALYTGCPFCL